MANAQTKLSPDAIVKVKMRKTVAITFIFGWLAITTYGQSPDVRLRHYLELSRRYEQQQPDSAVYYANKGIQLAEQQKNQAALGDLLLQLGEINGRHKHLDLARKFYNEALATFRRSHDPAGIASSYDALGLLDHDSGEFDKALNYYRDTRDSSGIMATYTAMGKAAQEKGDTGKAVSFYLRALAQYEHRAHRPEAYYSLIETIGHLYEQQGDNLTALRYFREAIRDSIKEGLPQTATHLYNAEGEVFEKQHDEKDALSAYKQALADARKNRQPDEQAEALLGIADILKKTNARGSIADLKQALVIAQNLRQPQLEARIYTALSAVYRQQKDYGEAMTALEEQHHLVDSLLSADTVKEISALDSSYALETSHEQVQNLRHINKLEAILLWCGLAILLIILALLALLWVFLEA